MEKSQSLLKDIRLTIQRRNKGVPPPKKNNHVFAPVNKYMIGNFQDKSINTHGLLIWRGGRAG